jgi:hypothetical protein
LTFETLVEPGNVPFDKPAKLGLAEVFAGISATAAVAPVTVVDVDVEVDVVVDGAVDVVVDGAVDVVVDGRE